VSSNPAFLDPLPHAFGQTVFLRPQVLQLWQPHVGRVEQLNRRSRFPGSRLGMFPFFAPLRLRLAAFLSRKLFLSFLKTDSRSRQYYFSLLVVVRERGVWPNSCVCILAAERLEAKCFQTLSSEIPSARTVKQIGGVWNRTC
jgi:hypothetical protein